jgi:CDP-glucose 4,6-dehydratase
VRDVITKYEIEGVFHLGAQPIVTTGVANPAETFETNIMGTVNLLETLRTYGNVKSVVVASSDKAYGAADVLPYVEETPLKGGSPYEASKACEDLVAQSYLKTYDLPVTVARFGNIYGPGDLNFNRIVPGAIRAALLNETLKLRSDGKMVREYLYVKDVVDGYLMLAENIAKSRGEAFNLSSGLKLSVIEVIERASKAIGRKINYEVMNTHRDEIREQYLSTKKVEKLLGWRVKHKFDDSIRTTFDWYKKIIR